MNETIISALLLAYWIVGEELLKRFLCIILPGVCTWAGVPLEKNVFVSGGTFITVEGNAYIENAYICESVP
ncbi:hypothetical protein CVT25_010512 [Psilocybe cyanescens]|uniref:Uncharacterized protein n=1 Tax=Psilocybe cyanescens TaxID=93625 RepID=A0A409XNR8_PSICY|nr:hypothetical protein CVT25_010512 [Psilocybe cyanescens]